MFTNFIYFIIALLIYITYQPSSEKQLDSLETAFFFAATVLFFTGFTWVRFSRLKRRLPVYGITGIEHPFNSAVTGHSILAIAFYAFDIYILNLPSFFYNLPLFIKTPTLLGFGFLLLFIGYLSVVWGFSHPLHTRIYSLTLGKGAYIFSNISFSIPVVLPWLLLSGISDLIFALPFETPRKLLSTKEGEIAYFLIFLIAVSVFGPFIIQKFWRCRPLEPGYFRSRIESMCEKTRLKYADILHWPLFGGRMITAGVMGLVRRFRYILVTDALLTSLDPQELDAVISHEIGHIKKRHLPFYLFFFLGYLLVSYATYDLILYAVIHAEPLYRLLERIGLGASSAHSIIFSLIIIAVFLIYFRYGFGYFMRNFERQADGYVFMVLDTGRPLISTLEKIAYSGGQPMDKPNWHHFSIRERIDFLNRCEADRNSIFLQDRKIRRSMGGYLLFILLVAALGYQINFGQTGKRLNERLIEKILSAEIERNPGNANLYGILGDISFNSRRYQDAARAYETAIALKPENPRVLNNLAWLYAVCEDKSIKNPERAVRLAQAALSYESSPHIWDTLAQSLFEAGRHSEAIDAASRALAMAKGDRSYYEEQLQKFRASIPE
ncbi:MAG: M48 family metalloprotease [Thermodesulfobacteriota bacterium]